MIGPALAPTRPGEPRRIGLAVGMGLLLLIALVSIAAPWLAPADPTFESSGRPQRHSASRSMPAHPGTSWAATQRAAISPRACIFGDPDDARSRRCTAVGIATLAGLMVGLLAANSRRFAGELLMRFTDLGLAIPGLLLAAAIASILGRGVTSLIIGLAAVFWAPIARVTYGQAVVLREREYVEAARVQGAGSVAVLLRHVFPHLLPVVGAYAALSVGWAVLFEASLGFLGAGVPEPESSLGSMLGSYLVYYRTHPGLILFPALALGLLVIAANLVGESLRPRDEGGR